MPSILYTITLSRIYWLKLLMSFWWSQITWNRMYSFCRETKTINYICI
jgi:hypothetical protein